MAWPAGPGLTLYTHLHVRENELALYGCESEEELALFPLAFGVSGIGPKVRFRFSLLPADRLQVAIAQEDVARWPVCRALAPRRPGSWFDLKDKVPQKSCLESPASPH